MLALRSHKEMLPVLMDPAAAGPDVHYYMIRGGSEKKNITVWESGKVGDEYIKTFGHYHVSDFVETYEILAGEGIIMLQSAPVDNEVEWVKAIFVKPGDQVSIPKRAGHLGVNTGKSWLVTLDDSPVNFKKRNEASMPEHADYQLVRKMHGFAYYIVEKNGEPFFIKNPNYKNHPDVIIEKA